MLVLCLGQIVHPVHLPPVERRGRGTLWQWSPEIIFSTSSHNNNLRFKHVIQVASRQRLLDMTWSGTRMADMAKVVARGGGGDESQDEEKPPSHPHTSGVSETQTAVDHRISDARARTLIPEKLVPERSSRCLADSPT